MTKDPSPYVEDQHNHPPTLVLLRNNHFKPLHELTDEIIRHAYDYYYHRSTDVSDNLEISLQTLYRKGFRGSKHRARGTSRPKQRKNKVMAVTQTDIAGANAQEAQAKVDDLEVLVDWLIKRVRVLEEQAGVTPSDQPELPSERKRQSLKIAKLPPMNLESIIENDMGVNTNPVELAAQRLIKRYYRRFPQVHWSKWDVQSIKDQKWYHNIPRLIAARMRLGGAPY